MGFDVFGMHSKSRRGEYFCNDIWSWRRLWDFCCYVACFGDEVRGVGHSNSGLVVAGRHHVKLRRSLEYALDNKDEFVMWIKASEKAYLTFDDGRLVCRHPFTWENVHKFYGFIRNNDGFKIC